MGTTTGLLQLPIRPSAAPKLFRLLVVEDDPRLRETVCDLVAGDGREVLSCGTGSEALDSLRRARIDLVLLDLHLPDQSGLEVMRWIRDSGLDTAVIVISGDDRVDSAIVALRCGAHEFIRKPFEPAALMRSVDNALTARSLEFENGVMRACLEQSERLHRYLVDNSPDLIFTVDAGGRFGFVNDRFSTLIGYSRDELAGMHFSTIIHESDVKHAEWTFRERRTGERAGRNVEVRLKRKQTDGSQDAPSEVTAVVSAMGIYRAEPSGGPYSERFQGTYGVARDITERKRAEQIIAFHAFHDALTGLPNRALFTDRLQQAIAHARRYQTRLAVLFVDLDRFKLVNDTYGHLKGDQLLQHTASRLRHCLRGSDTLSRMGGDEFIAFVSDLQGREDADAVATKILHELREPFSLGSGDFRISVSVGIAVFPQDGVTESELIRNADAAMYQVKKSGKNGIAFFEPAMSASFSERLHLENDLRGAIEHKEFELFFQPIHNVRTGSVERLEALIRWHHPVHGLLAPGRFIHIAEDSGLVHALGDYVLESACTHLEGWHSRGFAGLGVAVNLSPRDFESPTLVERVTGIVRRHHLPHGALELEITENVLIEDIDAVARKTAQLRDQGVHISIDDFGTRYSSLGYLQSLPISTLKIDQSFVRNLGPGNSRSPIVAAIISIARELGLGMVAEGVERPEHRDSLTALGCDVMQGYFFSRPIPSAQVSDYLTRNAALHVS